MGTSGGPRDISSEPSWPTSGSHLCRGCLARRRRLRLAQWNGPAGRGATPRTDRDQGARVSQGATPTPATAGGAAAGPVATASTGLCPATRGTGQAAAPGATHRRRRAAAPSTCPDGARRAGPRGLRAPRTSCTHPSTGACRGAAPAGAAGTPGHVPLREAGLSARCNPLRHHRHDPHKVLDRWRRAGHSRRTRQAVGCVARTPFAGSSCDCSAEPVRLQAWH